MLSRFWQFCFGCNHDRYSWPQHDALRDENYVMCLSCATRLVYDTDKMHIVSRKLTRRPNRPALPYIPIHWRYARSDDANAGILPALSSGTQSNLRLSRLPSPDGPGTPHRSTLSRLR